MKEIILMFLVSVGIITNMFAQDGTTKIVSVILTVFGLLGLFIRLLFN